MIRVDIRIKNDLTCAKKLFACLLLVLGLEGCSSAARYIATLATESAVITTPTPKQAQPQGAVGQLQDEPALSNILHPGPDSRYDQARKEQGEIPVLMCSKAGEIGNVSQWKASRSCGSD